MMRPDFRDSRQWLLASALMLLATTFIMPQVAVSRASYDVLAIIDVTGSMNVRDYWASGRPASRLDAVKSGLRDLVTDLPCSSRVGLGVFTERRPFLLFEPIDACADFSPLEAAIESLDWRMAWEGDSRISAGLFRAIDLARELKADLLFFTDGHEAPPLPAFGGSAFDGKAGETRGLIVGVGGYDLSPIPKFDERGREAGFVGIDEVPHESRFGLPPSGAEQREGFNARNAPFGATATVGVEHLSSVKEEYLRTLADKTGLGYVHLDTSLHLRDAWLAAATSRLRAGQLDLRPFLGAAAALLLFSAFVGPLIAARLSRIRRAAPFGLGLKSGRKI